MPQLYDAMGVKGNDLDMGVSMGWCSDYPDPYDWINVLLYGGAIQSENNNNYSYMNISKWNKKMEAAARLTGPKRLSTYSKLDLDIIEAGRSDGNRAHLQQPLPLLQPGQSEEPDLPGHLPGLEHPGNGTEVSLQWH